MNLAPSRPLPLTAPFVLHAHSTPTSNQTRPFPPFRKMKQMAALEARVTTLDRHAPPRHPQENLV
ncbi:hypothetical protein E2C01_085596 [Portunus trituberculatus]|uniref:Uncharacterized protein n=1 Tax=Portunus trituberculatus TaxID=210409 RepID=A0A5B7IYI6_PORTR|nr:hypothetical protein [Portunus trituberculatus]